jgi:hypothetical protein
MTTILKKNKSVESLINEYMTDLVDNCEKNRPSVKKNSKVRDENVIIPTVNNYEILNKYNYNLTQLKKIAKNYKIKISGNKNQLTSRVYSYLYFSSFIIKIQKIFRGQIARKYKTSHGPAALNRKLCTNACDFITMDPVENINFHQFLSYTDEDGFVYGFDIISLHTLFLKSKDMETVRNPYNRNLIPEYVIKTIKSILRLSRILRIHINMHYDEDIPVVSTEKAIELRALGLFQSIDALGNYSDPAWFLSLNRHQLVKFIRELADIWNYRAQITNETKRNICPPFGDPFRSLGMQYIYTEENIWNVKTAILEVLEKFVNSGIDNDSKSLGACYILGSLTLVNESAATSLPWLYQSFGHF